MEKLKVKNFEIVTFVIGVIMLVVGGFMPLGKFERFGASFESNLISIVGSVLSLWFIGIFVYTKVVNRDLPK